MLLVDVSIALLSSPSNLLEPKLIFQLLSKQFCNCIWIIIMGNIFTICAVSWNSNIVLCASALPYFIDCGSSVTDFYNSKSLPTTLLFNLSWKSTYQQKKQKKLVRNVFWICIQIPDFLFLWYFMLDYAWMFFVFIQYIKDLVTFILQICSINQSKRETEPENQCEMKAWQCV